MREVKRECSVEGCALAHYGRGYCKRHYDRVVRLGEPGEAPSRKTSRGDPCRDCGIRPRVGHSYCTECTTKRTNAWREAHPGAHEELNRRRYQENREALREQQRQWRLLNAEEKRVADRRWRAANIDTVRAKGRAYYEANRARFAEDFARRYRENPELIKARVKAWQVRNPERVAAKWAAWHAANPEKIRAASHRIRALRRAAPGTYTAEEWMLRLVEYEGRCAYCFTGDAPITVEHIVALRGGGTNSIGNVVPACRTCNMSKKATPLLAWLDLPPRVRRSREG